MYPSKELYNYLACWKLTCNKPGPHSCLNADNCNKLANMFDRQKNKLLNYTDLVPLLEDYIIKQELDELIDE